MTYRSYVRNTRFCTNTEVIVLARVFERALIGCDINGQRISFRRVDINRSAKVYLIGVTGQTKLHDIAYPHIRESKQLDGSKLFVTFSTFQ